jgi:hypothetical protein
MLIGGLWHGAGWTFVAWGGLHGIYLVINHQWTAVRSRRAAPGRVEVAAGAILTFVAVVVAWVFFRATSFHGAAVMLEAMAGFGGPPAPASIDGSGAASVDLLAAWSWCIVLLMITTFLPNTQEFVARRISDRAAITVGTGDGRAVAWAAPGLAVAAGLGLLAALAVMNLSRPSEFLYFNF